MNSSLSKKIITYFGALYLLCVGMLFFVWYFGIPQIGLIGAGSQRLAEALEIIEIKADLHRNWIVNGLVARRGDILSLAESPSLANMLEKKNVGLQDQFERRFERLLRAYPDRYRHLSIIAPDTGKVLASSVADTIGLPFPDLLLVERANTPGATELIEQFVGPDGKATLGIVRQIYSVGADGYPSHTLIGILVAQLDLQNLLNEGFSDGISNEARRGSTLLFDQTGVLLAGAESGARDVENFRLSAQVLPGFEGSLQEVSSRGRELFVIYRHVQLSGSQAWTMVHYVDKQDALGELRGRVSLMISIGLLLTLISLGLISVAARRLTLPLRSLADIARRLGAGDLSARELSNPSGGRELSMLAEAFNSMAVSIERSHRTLEFKVAERTAELETERDRVQFYLDIAGVMLMALDRNGCITMINRRGQALLEQSESALLGQDWFAHFVPEAESAARRAGFDQMIAADGRAIEYAESTVVLKDGRQFLLAWSIILLRDANGVVIGNLSSAEDVTERRQAESELRIAATTFESHEGMIVTDANFKILRINKAFSDITGYSADEVIGNNPKLLNSGRQDKAFFDAMWRSLNEVGVWHGEIWNRRKNGEVYPEWLTISAVTNEVGIPTHYVGTFTDITLRKAAEDEIRNLAFYDPLTSLPNRRLLMDRLEKALAGGVRHHRKGALLFVDLDNFKTLNDTLGHDKGDLLLQQVGVRMAACVRDVDTVARLGGDEFVVMLEDLSEDTLEAATQAELVGEKILAALAAPYFLAGFQIHSTPSIGITLFGETVESIDEPIKRADMAMYQAKSAGRNTLRFFDPQTQRLVTARVTMEVELREALLQKQFLLYYQPQMAGDDQVVGAEALVRWLHPTRGMVSPAEFIHLAEETGLILPLGHWVLETACRQLTLWADDPVTAHLTLAVNVSAKQFSQEHFVAEVLDILAATGANPLLLKLELTESLMVDKVEDIIAKMVALKSHGVGFSLDDFGTGYSSLSYLKRLPLDQMKIDQGFVRDILIDANDAAIANMVVALAGSMKIAVIAEGVETLEQKEFLAKQGCHFYQGYFFSRPLPIAQFDAFARQRCVPA